MRLRGTGRAKAGLPAAESRCGCASSEKRGLDTLGRSKADDQPVSALGLLGSGARCLPSRCSVGATASQQREASAGLAGPDMAVSETVTAWGAVSFTCSCEYRACAHHVLQAPKHRMAQGMQSSPNVNTWCLLDTMVLFQPQPGDKTPVGTESPRWEAMERAASLVSLSNFQVFIQP